MASRESLEVKSGLPSWTMAGGEFELHRPTSNERAMRCNCTLELQNKLKNLESTSDK